MATKGFLRRAVLFSVFLCLVAGNAPAWSAPLTAQELLENERLRDHIQELKDGEIVILKNPQTEDADQLDVYMVLLAPASLPKTVETLQHQATAEGSPGVLAAGEIAETKKTSELDEMLAGVVFNDQETREVEKLMSGDAWDEFNFSREEIAIVKRLAEGLQGEASTNAAAIGAMSKAMREILLGRYMAYRRKGLDGLAPYWLGPSEEIYPSAELISATEDLKLIKKRFPHYYDCLRFYPNQPSEELLHQFFWAKQLESGRPLFLLKHWIVDIQSDYALITERRYYLDHSLNCLQVTIGCLPHQDGTLVVLFNQTFTEKVNLKFGRTIAKAIGYKQVEKNIRPLFENLQSALGH